MTVELHYTHKLMVKTWKFLLLLQNWKPSDPVLFGLLQMSSSRTCFFFKFLNSYCNIMCLLISCSTQAYKNCQIVIKVKKKNSTGKSCFIHTIKCLSICSCYILIIVVLLLVLYACAREKHP